MTFSEEEEHCIIDTVSVWIVVLVTAVMILRSPPETLTPGPSPNLGEGRFDSVGYLFSGLSQLRHPSLGTGEGPGVRVCCDGFFELFHVLSPFR